MTRPPEDYEPGPLGRLRIFLDIVEQMDMGPLNHFTCTEAEALADLMMADRGPEAGQWVIIHHLVDGEDEDFDELGAHVERWPDLSAALREYVSDDVEVIHMLDEYEFGPHYRRPAEPGCGHNNQELTAERLVRCVDCGRVFTAAEQENQ